MLAPDEALVSEVLVAACEDERAAEGLRGALERERARACGGPFRTSADQRVIEAT